MQSKYEEFCTSLQKNIFRYFKGADKVVSKMPAIEWMSQMLRVCFELVIIEVDSIDVSKLIKFLFFVVSPKYTLKPLGTW